MKLLVQCVNWVWSDFSETHSNSLLHIPCCRLVNVTLPKKTRKNGTLFAMAFVHQAGVVPWQDQRQVHQVTLLTTYMLPKPPEVSLISGEEEQKVSVQQCHHTTC